MIWFRRVIIGKRISIRVVKKWREKGWINSLNFVARWNWIIISLCMNDVALKCSDFKPQADGFGLLLVVRCFGSILWWKLSATPNRRDEEHTFSCWVIKRKCCEMKREVLTIPFLIKFSSIKSRGNKKKFFIEGNFCKSFVRFTWLLKQWN